MGSRRNDRSSLYLNFDNANNSLTVRRYLSEKLPALIVRKKQKCYEQREFDLIYISVEGRLNILRHLRPIPKL